MADTPRDVLVELYRMIAKSFNREELKDLCFILDVPYDDLPGEGRRSKARELASYLQRRGRLQELVHSCMELRAGLPWPTSVPSEGPGLPSIEPFPYSDGTAAIEAGWLSGVEKWFRDTCAEVPREAMALLLDHVFEVIVAAQNSNIILRKTMKLGKQLEPCIPEGSRNDLTNPHHRTILLLLKGGLYHCHPRLFNLPQVSKSNLLNIPDYSALLLATKLYAAGAVNQAYELAKSIASGCSLAQYITGQCERRNAEYLPALYSLSNGLRSLDKGGYACPFGKETLVVCDKHLLRAELFRAMAVVYRKLKESENAELYYGKAVEAIEALPEESVPSRTPFDPEDTIEVDYNESSLRLKAAIYFSHGYYRYQEKKDYAQAEALFKKAIGALKNAREEWDSPYTRLAIIRFREGSYKESASLFLEARRMCEMTPVQKNRDVPLSLALCTLGLKCIEICSSDIGKLTHRDPMRDLEKAINQEPRLSLGPLECHLDDSRNLLLDTLPSKAEKLVNRFVDRLQEEADRLGAKT